MTAQGGGLSVAASVSTARGGDLGPFLGLFPALNYNL